jgi:hypothetical protein
MSEQEWGMGFRLITELDNNKISRGMFVIDWAILQKKQGIAVRQGYEKGNENKR